MKYLIASVVAWSFLSHHPVEAAQLDKQAFQTVYMAPNDQVAWDQARKVFDYVAFDVQPIRGDGKLIPASTISNLVARSIENIRALLGGWPQNLIASFERMNISGRKDYIRLVLGEDNRYVCFHQFAKGKAESDDIRKRLIRSLIFPSMTLNKNIGIKFEYVIPKGNSRAEEDFVFDEAIGQRKISEIKVREPRKKREFKNSIPEYIRVTFNCYPQAGQDLAANYGPLYEITLCNKSASHVDVFAPKIGGVTFRYQLGKNGYELIQVFPTSWEKVQPETLSVIAGEAAYVKVSKSSEPEPDGESEPGGEE